jgi:protein phosphatase
MRAPDKLQIEIPDFALVVLIGASGSGKSTFAAKHFLPTEIISPDYCRGLVSDDETDQAATADAFDLVRVIAEKRLKRRKLAVIDATNVRAADRKGWVEVARRWHALPVAIVIEPGIDICIERTSPVRIANSAARSCSVWWPKFAKACAVCSAKAFAKSGN